MAFRLHPRLELAAPTDAFAAERRVRIHPFLDDAVAIELHALLRRREDWRQVINSGDKVFELDRATRAAMETSEAAALDAAVHAGAREGFQYRYETVRLPDGDPAMADRADCDMLDGFTAWLSGGQVRETLRRITGFGDIAFADGQATAYSPGDFLTGHLDDVPGKGRRAAYVLGLTPVWRADGGGLLLVHGGVGGVAGNMPGFNTLDLFAVPQLHSVSLVTPAAAYRRYAITGWLRAEGDQRDGG